MMNSRLFLVAALTALTLFVGTGCKKKTPVVAPGADPLMGQDALGGVGTDDGSMTPVDGALPGRAGGTFTATDDPALGGAEGFVIYFAFDSSEVGTSQQAVLDHAASLAKDHADMAILVEGHCDDRGSDEYNRGLGERRALAVREYLGMAGASDAAMETISYGEEKPAVPNASSEEDHAKNRRGVVIFGTRSN